MADQFPDFEDAMFSDPHLNWASLPQETQNRLRAAYRLGVRNGLVEAGNQGEKCIPIPSEHWDKFSDWVTQRVENAEAA
ncbi:MAG: hypothetical protein EOO38_21155 [Cytophagaceae bacterium]|nr:MAG: hypothetical protein EOO38_21155 [Cytophagaceae bacterium]